MAKTTLIHGDAADYAHLSADIMLTDPPFEMSGEALAGIINRYPVQHLLLLTTMRQLLGFMRCGTWTLNFDFVFDGVAPKQSKSKQQPNYIHSTGVYLTRNGARSLFNRKRRQRSDVFEATGYWPTIFYAPRTAMHTHGHAKSEAAVADLLGSFDVQAVIDPFCGSGTTALAAFECGIHCTLIERDAATFTTLQKTLRFMSAHSMEIIT